MKSTIQMENTTASLLVSCPDKKGLVAKIANFIYSNGGNIIHADQHTDFENGLFLTRIEWQLDNFNLPRDLIAPAFSSIAQPLQAKWELHFSDSIPRIAIFVSKQEHCLLGFLGFNVAGKWKRKINGIAPKEAWFILTNFDSLESAV